MTTALIGSSNKYERWVERDPDTSQVIEEAWKLLLTDNYTLEQLCDELAAKGYTRASGRPWVWNDPKTGSRTYAETRLHKIFHNPFYAGWGVSKRFGIKIGEVQGQWEPIITMQEYERGIAILHKHDAYKSRNKVHHYLLKGLLFIETNGKRYKMYCSTPSGKNRSYSYYITRAKIEGKKIHIPCQIVDKQIPDLIKRIMIDPIKEPVIQKVYQAEIKRVTHDDRDETIATLKRQKSRLKMEESRLGRLFMTSKISEEVYDQLRKEWQEKVGRFELSIAELEYEKQIRIDDLDAALVLMSMIGVLYKRLGAKERSKLLQILVKQFIVNLQGNIIDYQLNPPFAYLHYLVDDLSNLDSESWCSTQVPVGVLAIKEVIRFCGWLF